VIFEDAQLEVQDLVGRVIERIGDDRVGLVADQGGLQGQIRRFFASAGQTLVGNPKSLEALGERFPRLKLFLLDAPGFFDVPVGLFGSVGRHIYGMVHPRAQVDVKARDTQTRKWDGAKTIKLVDLIGTVFTALDRGVLAESTAAQLRDRKIGNSMPQAAIGGSLSDTRPAGGAGPLSPTNVGGVYLRGAGDALAHLGHLTGVVRDEGSGRIMLLSEQRGPIALPPLRIDDLVTIFRCVYESGDAPWVSIDPDPRDPRGPVMLVATARRPPNATSAGCCSSPTV
jgi:hypothetical protein